jgi:hypothetical protein
MTNVFALILTIAAGSTLVFGTIIVWILMGYYSVKIFKSFKGGVLMNGWRYICVAIPFLIFGQLATGLGDSGSTINSAQELFRALGITLSLAGSILIVIGFRSEYQAWNNPKQTKVATSPHKQEEVASTQVAA